MANKGGYQTVRPKVKSLCPSSARVIAYNRKQTLVHPVDSPCDMGYGPRKESTGGSNASQHNLGATQAFSLCASGAHQFSAEAGGSRAGTAQENQPAVMNELRVHDRPIHTHTHTLQRAQINCQGAAPESVPKYPSARTKAIHETAGLKIDAQTKVYINTPLPGTTAAHPSTLGYYCVCSWASDDNAAHRHVFRDGEENSFIFL